METHQHQPVGWNLEEGHLALDFINTCYIQTDAAAPFGYQLTDEHLHTTVDLATWAIERGVLDAVLAEAIREMPEASGAVEIERLRSVREALRRVIRAHIRNEPPATEMLDEVNRELLLALQGTQLVPTDGTFLAAGPAPDESSAAAGIGQIRWALGLSVLSLLTDPEELGLIQECPGDDCGYLFRDASHGRRRWCSMSSCGNRAKVARFRERQKAS